MKLWSMRVLRPLAGRFPKFFYRVAWVVGWVGWHVRRDVRRNVVRNLLPLCDGDLPRAKREGVRVFQYVAQYYVDLATLPRRDISRFETEHLHIGNPEHLAQLEQPGPVVGISAHMGNPELAIQALTYRGRGFVALVEALDPPALADFVLRLRSAAGGRFYEADFTGLRACVSALKHGQLLGVMGDRDIQGTGICVPLCGRMVHLPRGPWELARRTNALVVPAFSRRRHFDDFDIVLEEPYFVDVSDSPETDIRKAAERYAMLLETYLRKEPGQWAVLEDFWRVHACAASEATS
jgi:KDO2-lipid IV(A) lauroyltransferase